MSLLQRQLLRSAGAVLYAELHELIDTVKLSQSMATLRHNSWSYAGGFVTIMVVGANVSTSSHTVDQL
jgi:hypothetical protein